KNIPNMLTQFTGLFSSKGVNVSEMVSKSRGDFAYTILDISVAADQAVADAIAQIDGVVRVRVIK
ncbi:MAG: 3-phosphoglycerate dehydrogenase, partial [Eubacterium sp.]|nr:3-phosphoglycerate dehydrogenase [Eubacterium sp.]